MKLKKILLPLTFLGLSPTARAADNTQTTDSVPQNKTERVTDFSDITFIPKKTIDFFDAQEDSIRRAVNDSISAAEMTKVYSKLIKTYNANPERYKISQLIDLLNNIDNPNALYDTLMLSLPHANYLSTHITSELQKKLNISDTTDIIVTAVDKRTYDMPDQDAFDFACTGKYFDRIQNPDVVLNQALQIALRDITQIGKNTKYKDCIIKITDFVFSHQDDSKLINLYSDVFLATAKTIREYNERIDNQDLYLASMNTLVPLIEKYNAQIIPNSALDKEISIKKPHDYVIKQYDDIFTRITLTNIYNQAYLNYMLQSYDLRKRIYGNNVLHNIYINYIDAIELNTISRTKKLTPDQQEKLDNLLKLHPEIALFDPYFSNVYFNTSDRHDIIEYLTKIKFSKQEYVNVPHQLSEILEKHQTNADSQRKIILENLIKIPALQLTLANKVSYYDIMNKSNLTPINVHDSIERALRKQYDDVTVQKNSLIRITNNNNNQNIQQQNTR